MSLRDRMNEKVMRQLSVDKATIERNLDLIDGLSTPITVKQFDHNSRVLCLTLEKKRGVPLDLTNTSVYLIIRRPDKEKVKLPSTNISLTGGKVEFSFTQRSLAIVGKADCEVVVLGADESILSFPVFDMTIQESIYDEIIDILSNDEEEEFPTIEDLDSIN